MSNNIANRIARITGCNCQFNRRILCIKRSWDEVAAILQRVSCSKSSGYKSPCCNSSHRGHKR